jgi:hypothetical protein
VRTVNWKVLSSPRFLAGPHQLSEEKICWWDPNLVHSKETVYWKITKASPTETTIPPLSLSLSNID